MKSLTFVNIIYFSLVEKYSIDSILLILREIILSLMNFIVLFSLFSKKPFKGLNVVYNYKNYLSQYRIYSFII